MSLALVVVMVTLAGRLLLTHFDQELRVNWACLLSISFIVGLGFYTWALYLALLAGMPMSIWTVGGVIGVLLIAGFLLRRKPAEGSPLARLPELWAKGKIGDWGLLAALAPLLLFSGYIAFKTPIYWPDAIFYYDGMGRTLFVDGSIYAPEVKANLFFHGQPALFLPLIHATSYALSADRVAVLYAGFYAAMVVMFGFLRWEPRLSTRPGATRAFLASLPWRLITVSVATVPFLFAMGYVVLSSLPAAVYLFGGVLVWKRFLEQPSRRLAILTGVLLALSSWTRADAVYFFLPVLALTLGTSIVNRRIRRHTLALLLVPLVMDLFKYAIVVFSGQIEELPAVTPVPYLDLLIDGSAVAFGLVVSRSSSGALQGRMAWLILAGVALAAVGLAAFVIAAPEGVGGSAVRLWRLVTDPVWGATSVFVVVALFSPSLFRLSNWLVILAVTAMIILRILLYTGVSGLGISDATITHSGNRVLLYIWPLLLYWVSCSRELRRLFVIPGKATKLSSRRRHS